MKKFFLLGMMVCLAMVVNAQRSMEWYSYWGSNEPGNQIDPQRMAVDKDGNIYVAATFGGAKVAVENQKLESKSTADNGDAVVIKMSATKQVVWSYPIVNTGKATISDIAIDSKGNIFAMGSFDNSIKSVDGVMKPGDLYADFGTISIYVIKLSDAGKLLAAWQIAASDGAKAGKMAIDSKDNVVISGLLDGDAVFEAGKDAEGDAQNSAQLFVAKYDNGGKLLWHQFRNDEGATSTYGLPSIALDDKNNMYVATSLTGKTTFAGNKLEAASSNALLLNYDAEGQEGWYHIIGGNESDAAGAIAYNPCGLVAIAVNHHSGDLYIDGKAEEYNSGYTFAASYTHSAFFAFDTKGDFKWFYDWGYSNGEEGSDAVCHALRCTDEGVWYAAGMMTGRFGGSRLYEFDKDNPLSLPKGKNSGVETVDRQWLQHNTNGGWDCYVLTLTRNGKLANAIRPGGTQYETGVDIALSPDKKSMYLLMQINVRNNIPYTCPDNLFDSFSDLYAPTEWESRKSDYTLLNVYCPENKGKSDNYTDEYKAKFASSMLVKYAMPEINPNMLPYFTVNEAYNQKIAVADPKGKAMIYALERSNDVKFENDAVSGTFADENDRYVGLIASDSIAVPGNGKIKYYEYDQETHRSLRSLPRNVRYMALTIKKSDVDPEPEPEPEPGDEGLEMVNGKWLMVNGQKVIRDGILYIERNGQLYNAQGQVVL